MGVSAEEMVIQLEARIAQMQAELVAMTEQIKQNAGSAIAAAGNGDSERQAAAELNLDADLKRRRQAEQDLEQLKGGIQQSQNQRDGTQVQILRF